MIPNFFDILSLRAVVCTPNFPTPLELGGWVTVSANREGGSDAGPIQKSGHRRGLPFVAGWNADLGA